MENKSGSVPITVNEYSELKQSLKQSEMRMQELLHGNTRLGEEVALLQNMASCLQLLSIQLLVFV